MNLRICFIIYLGIFFSSMTAANSGWILDEKIDSFTDQKVVVAIASGGGGNLAIRCQGENFDVYVNFGEYLGDKLIDVRYRIDKDSPVNSKWNSSTNGSTVFVDERSKKHLSRLFMKGDTFLIEATDFRGTPHRASFDLTGSSEAIGPVMAQCGISEVGMDQTVDGLRLEIALELDLWGPQQISMSKKILSALGEYNGSQNSTLDSNFVLAVQNFYDRYIENCKQEIVSGKVSGVICSGINEHGSDSHGSDPSSDNLRYAEYTLSHT